jgi:hypothetical protein
LFPETYHESGTCDDLEQAESEFDLAVASNTEVLNDGEQEQERDDPGRVVDMVDAGPKVNDLQNISLSVR